MKELEQLDKKFKKACAKQAKEYYKGERKARREGGYAFAIEMRAKAEVFEDLAENGITVMDD